MIYAALKAVHVLSIIVWVGGMVFAHFFLRPALAQLEPAPRLRLMHEVLGRFFRAVLAASLLTLVSGIWMFGRAAGQGQTPPLAWIVMALLGTLMVAIFLHIRFVPYRRLARAVTASDWPAGAAAMAQIRRWVGINLGLGGVILLVTLLRWPG